MTPEQALEIIQTAGHEDITLEEVRLVPKLDQQSPEHISMVIAWILESRGSTQKRSRSKSRNRAGEKAQQAEDGIALSIYSLETVGNLAAPLPLPPVALGDANNDETSPFTEIISGIAESQASGERIGNAIVDYALQAFQNPLEIAVTKLLMQFSLSPEGTFEQKLARWNQFIAAAEQQNNRVYQSLQLQIQQVRAATVLLTADDSIDAQSQAIA